MSKDWPDERLDDLNTKTETNAQAISYVAGKVIELQTEMKNLKDSLTQKSTGKINWWMIGATFSNSLTAFVVYLISKGK